MVFAGGKSVMSIKQLKVGKTQLANFSLKTIWSRSLNLIPILNSK
jgi:hypothetical protein